MTAVRYVSRVEFDHRQLFLPDCYVNKLPSRTVHADSDAVVGEITRTIYGTDGTKKNTGINISKWTAQPIVVPPDQPLVPVRPKGNALGTAHAALRAVMETGFPIPDGWTPTSDGDSHGIFWQPDWQTPDGRFKGRYWELFAAAVEPPESPYRYAASFGGRMCDVERNRGHFESFPDWAPAALNYRNATPGHPDSAMQSSGWGGTGTSIPLIAGMVLKEDIERGAIEHVVGVSVSDCNRTTKYPAQRNDGYNTALKTSEGMILYLPEDHVPQSPHWFVRLLEDAAARQGMVIWDKSSGYVMLRGEPGLNIGTAPSYDQLATFPWSKLQVRG